MVKLIFCTDSCTPALIETRPATAAFRLMSARKLSTSREILPTERLGTFKITSAGPVSGATVLIAVVLVGEEIMDDAEDVIIRVTELVVSVEERRVVVVVREVCCPG